MTNYEWMVPPVKPVLIGDDVHVWCAATNLAEQQVYLLAQTLSIDELNRACHFHYAHLTRYFIVRRGILRSILARYLCVTPGSLRFNYTEYGKPFLADINLMPSLQFNVSHSGNRSLYAIAAKHAVGVDIERMQEQLDHEQLARQSFSNLELRAFDSLPMSQRATAFFTGWTRKEAYVKALGQGLSVPLDQFSVSLKPGDPAEILAYPLIVSRARSWFLSALTFDPDYVAALVVEGKRCRLTLYQWLEQWANEHFVGCDYE